MKNSSSSSSSSWTSSSRSTTPTTLTSYVIPYIVFGIIHEFSHLIAGILANMMYYYDPSSSPFLTVLLPTITTTTDKSSVDSGGRYYISILYRLLLGRNISLQFHQQQEQQLFDNHDDQQQQFYAITNFVRHVGWITSLIVLLFVQLRFYRGGSSNRQIRYACFVTLLEAIWTDLFQFRGMNHLLYYHDDDDNDQTTTTTTDYRIVTFFCGNFGMILLHGAWLHDQGSSALDVLQKMIEVTMMRGAQSGGVVTFYPTTTTNNKNNGGDKDETIASFQHKLRSVRSRVVNMKRTNLAQLIRQKVARRHNFKRFMLKNDGNGDHNAGGGRGGGDTTTATSAGRSTGGAAFFVPTFCGHTRFATSSKATMDGTHPHVWSKPILCNVYPMDVMKTNERNVNGATTTKKKKILVVTQPQLINVENFITHNGDFDFYQCNGNLYDLETIQNWLIRVLDCPMPAVVDSCALAGMVDVLRTRGSFGLSIRYAVGLGMPSSVIDGSATYPNWDQFAKVGNIFEETLIKFQQEQEEQKEKYDDNDNDDGSHHHRLLSSIEMSESLRRTFARLVAQRFRKHHTNMQLLKPLNRFVNVEEQSAAAHDEESDDPEGIYAFCLCTINAFFDNDLFWTTKTLLQGAKGSFGLVITSSLDAHRQICLAARGQTMSIAFYPRKGLICYGSEQAAVKAGLMINFPADETLLDRSLGEIDDDALRLDLDDLGGEIMVIDWGCKRYQNSPVSLPNQHLDHHELMNGAVQSISYQESKATCAALQDIQIYHRMTRLTRNRFVKPLPADHKDLVKRDIKSIPKYCDMVQNEWQSNMGANSLNRLTAYNLSRCLRSRLEAHAERTVSNHSVDILITGCEVSLWVGEQFASDLQKAFPKLRIMAVSSNKLLGLYGQDIAIPSFGFGYSPQVHNLRDTIVIIVSHSGGTFAPLACCNLIQSTTQNIFVVTSEWDTQIGKQLRTMDAITSNDDNAPHDSIFHSRIFSTEVGMRPAEPCSISVAATHQLLTNLFQYISVVILSDKRFRRVTGATISEQDIQILEMCNRRNIDALYEIVGDEDDDDDVVKKSDTEQALCDVGNLWADHVLENVRAYIMSFIYVFVTVITGYPLVYGFTAALKPNSADYWWIYIIRTIDACIYFWLPQINIVILRLVQRRALLHRMVGRTVVIGDIPWVAQAAEAFLSKLFACSYSIAGINVLSGNPSDHFVHRHTHRVVRGALVVCGRPDGRLSALSTAEAAVCLSVNQASSIQSLGGTCESITIGHNPFKLPLTAAAIFLKRHRPMFLCERLLIEADAHAENKNNNNNNHNHKLQPVDKKSSTSSSSASKAASGIVNKIKRKYIHQKRCPSFSDSRHGHFLETSIHPSVYVKRSAFALLGAYMNFEASERNHSEHSENEDSPIDKVSVDDVVEDVIRERKWSDKARKLFQIFDANGDYFITEEEFIRGANQLQWRLTEDELLAAFYAADEDCSGRLDFNEFCEIIMSVSDLDTRITVPAAHRDERGLIQVEPSNEKYFGETLRKHNAAGKSQKQVDFKIAKSQDIAMQLYETRIASLQRFVAMTVLFHQMGMRVERFFEQISFGLLGYRMDRTHSIMRIATTASPVSGSDVRQQMRHLQLVKKVKHSTHVISIAYLKYKAKKQAANTMANSGDDNMEHTKQSSGLPLPVRMANYRRIGI